MEPQPNSINSKQETTPQPQINAAVKEQLIQQEIMKYLISQQEAGVLKFDLKDIKININFNRDSAEKPSTQTQPKLSSGTSEQPSSLGKPVAKASKASGILGRNLPSPISRKLDCDNLSIQRTLESQTGTKKANFLSDSSLKSRNNFSEQKSKKKLPDQISPSLSSIKAVGPVTELVIPIISKSPPANCSSEANASILLKSEENTSKGTKEIKKMIKGGASLPKGQVLSSIHSKKPAKTADLNSSLCIDLTQNQEKSDHLDDEEELLDRYSGFCPPMLKFGGKLEHRTSTKAKNSTKKDYQSKNSQYFSGGVDSKISSIKKKNSCSFISVEGLAAASELHLRQDRRISLLDGVVTSGAKRSSDKEHKQGSGDNRRIRTKKYEFDAGRRPMLTTTTSKQDKVTPGKDKHNLKIQKFQSMESKPNYSHSESININSLISSQKKEKKVKNGSGKIGGKGVKDAVSRGSRDYQTPPIHSEEGSGNPKPVNYEIPIKGPEFEDEKKEQNNTIEFIAEPSAISVVTSGCAHHTHHHCSHHKNQNIGQTQNDPLDPEKISSKAVNLSQGHIELQAPLLLGEGDSMAKEPARHADGGSASRTQVKKPPRAPIYSKGKYTKSIKKSLTQNLLNQSFSKFSSKKSPSVIKNLKSEKILKTISNFEEGDPSFKDNSVIRIEECEEDKGGIGEPQNLNLNQTLIVEQKEGQGYDLQDPGRFSCNTSLMETQKNKRKRKKKKFNASNYLIDMPDFGRMVDSSANFLDQLDTLNAYDNQRNRWKESGAGIGGEEADFDGDEEKRQLIKDFNSLLEKIDQRDGGINDLYNREGLNLGGGSQISVSTARQEMIERYKQEFKEKINNFWRRGQAAERKLSTIQMFTNSYSSFSNSRIDFAPNPMQSPFDTMMSMLEDLYDKEDMENNVKVYNNLRESECHFAFLFASPLVIFKEMMGGQPVLQPILWDIDFMKDLKHIKTILRSVKSDVKFISSMASVSSLSSILKKKPMILHFCGHGIKNNDRVLDQLDGGDDLNSDYLLFEDKYGRAEVVNCELLKKHIADNYSDKNTLEFVFVASCHSEIVGEVFLQAGASHVVCVKRDEIISDGICNKFTELFYKALFGDNKTFCQAFDTAMMQIKSKEEFQGEEDKFLMLVQPSLMHQCTRLILKRSPHPKFTNLTKKPKFRRVPSKVDCFRGRKKELYQISELLDQYRFVVVKGMMGIGKSSLVKEFALRALNRHLLQDGVVYVNLRGEENTDALIDSLYHQIAQQSHQSAQQAVKGGILASSPLLGAAGKQLPPSIAQQYPVVFPNLQGGFPDNLSTMSNYFGVDAAAGAGGLADVSFTTNPNPLPNLDKQSKFEAIGQCFEQLELLLILDNIDGILFKQRAEFFRRLNLLMDRAFNLKILMTSFSRYEHCQTDFTLKIFELGPLTLNHSAKLLLERSPRVIEKSEIRSLFESFPLDDSELNKRFPLALHPIMNFFEGHPQTILMGASLTGKMKLPELFRLYSRADKLGKNELSSAVIPQSVQISLEFVGRILESQGAEFTKIFGLLALFPGGVTAEELESIFGMEKCTKILDFLVDYSIAKKKSRRHKDKKVRYYIHRLIQEKAKTTLGKDLAKYYKILTLHYLERVKKIFQYVESTAVQDKAQVEALRKSRLYISSFNEIEKNVKYLINVGVEISSKAARSTKSGSKGGSGAPGHNLLPPTSSQATKNPNKKWYMKSISSNLSKGSGNQDGKSNDFRLARKKEIVQKSRKRKKKPKKKRKRRLSEKQKKSSLSGFEKHIQKQRQKLKEKDVKSKLETLEGEEMVKLYALNIVNDTLAEHLAEFPSQDAKSDQYKVEAHIVEGLVGISDPDERSLKQVLAGEMKEDSHTPGDFSGEGRPKGVNPLARKGSWGFDLSDKTDTVVNQVVGEFVGFGAEQGDGAVVSDNQLSGVVGQDGRRKESSDIDILKPAGSDLNSLENHFQSNQNKELSEISSMYSSSKLGTTESRYDETNHETSQESGGPEDLNILLPELKLMKGASKNSNARMSATHRKRAGMRKKAYLYDDARLYKTPPLIKTRSKKKSSYKPSKGMQNMKKTATRTPNFKRGAGVKVTGVGYGGSSKRIRSGNSAMNQNSKAFSRFSKQEVEQLFTEKTKLVVYFCSVLITLKKFDSCQDILKEWAEICFKKEYILGACNMLRLLACICFLQKDHATALKLIQNIYKAFTHLDCKIGKAVCCYTIGQINYSKRSSATAKNHLKRAFEEFQNLNHFYGQYYSICNLLKISMQLRDKKGITQYKENKTKLDKIKKGGSQKTLAVSKNGRFSLKSIGFPASLLLEPCFKLNIQDQGVNKLKKSNRIKSELQKMRRSFVKLRNLNLAAKEK